MTRRQSTAKKLLRYTALALLSLLVAFVIAGSSISFFFTPKRLAEAVERISRARLNVDVTVSNAELSFWSTFPKITLRVDDINVVSRPLSQLSDSLHGSLPHSVDSLMSINRLTGVLNLSRLAKGEISLKDVTIDAPRVSLHKINDSLNNYDIIPDDHDSSSSIPDISIHGFTITNAKEISYTSHSDSTRLNLSLTTLSTTNPALPLYRLSLSGNNPPSWLQGYNLSDITLNLNGNIFWEYDSPHRVEISDFIVKLDGIDILLSSAIDFSDQADLEILDLKVNQLNIDALKRLSSVPNASL